MNYETKLKAYMHEHDVKAEHLTFQQSCHSVAEAAEAVHARPEDFVKSICLIADGNLVVAIVKGEDKVSTSEVGKIVNAQKIRTALPDEMLEKTGYPCGGTPAFGYAAIFLIDPRVMEKEVVYSGGGSETSLVKASPNEIQRANQGKIVRIRK